MWIPLPQWCFVLSLDSNWSSSSGEEHFKYRISGFFRVHPFSAMFAIISTSWKMHSTVSCKSGRLRLLLWFREILISVDLIHGFRVEFAEKTWRVNNLIYGKCFRLFSYSPNLENGMDLHFHKLESPIPKDIWLKFT